MLFCSFTVIRFCILNMAPKKVIEKPKVANALVGIRKSRRLNPLTSSERDQNCDEHFEENCRNLPLNDDCLRKIFAYLPIKELLRGVPFCCRKFRDLANDAVKEKCRKERFVYNYLSRNDASIVERFGGSMRDVEVFHRNMAIHSHSFAWLGTMAELKTLKVRNMMLKYESGYAATLRHLEHLTLEFNSIKHYLCLDDLNAFLRACQSLKSVNIMLKYTCCSCCRTVRITESDILTCVSTLENLERITIKSRPVYGVMTQLVPAITKIAQLKKLKFFSGTLGKEGSVDYIKALGACQSLEELVLEFLESAPPKRKFVGELDKFPKLR